LYFYCVKPVKKYICIFVLITLILFFGFLRETVFKNLNALLQAWDADIDYKMPFFLSFTENLDYPDVVKLKWLFTYVFSIIFLALSLLAIRLLFNDRRFIKITIISWTCILLLSAIFICTGLIFNDTDGKMYEFARYFAGIAQSPLILMILIPVFKLIEKEKESLPGK
jgi:hypothetical protein